MLQIMARMIKMAEKANKLPFQKSKNHQIDSKNNQDFIELSGLI